MKLANVNNDYGGGTNINDGTVEIADFDVLGAGGTNVSFDGGTLNTTAGQTGILHTFALNAGGGTFDVLAGTTVGLSGVIGGAGSLTKAGDGTLTLDANNTYTGATNIADGTLRMGAGNALSGSTAVTVSAGATLDLNNTNEAFGSLAGAGNVTFGFGVLNTLTVGGNGDTTTFSGVISGDGSLTKEGGGRMILTNGGNSYSAATNINGGILQIATGGALGAPGTIVTFDGGTLNTTGNNSIGKSITLNGGGGTVETNAGTTQNLNGVISGVGSLTKVGDGILALGGNNSYGGSTNINDGTLRISNNERLTDGSAVTVASGATFDLNNFNETVGSVAGAGNVTLGGGTLIAGGNDTDTVHTGAISGSGGLTKVGDGTMTLGAGGSTDHTGDTNVQGGTLQFQDRTGSLAGAVVNAANIALINANMAFNGLTSNSGSFGIDGTSAVTGGGSFTQSAGLLTVDGDMTQAGVTIDGGTVGIGGTIFSDVVLNDGFLGGSGSIVGSLTVNGGTVGPGFSPGTLTVDGDLILTSGELNLEVGDFLDVTGLFEIGEDVTVNLFVEDFTQNIIDLSFFFVGTDPDFVDGFENVPFKLFTTDLAFVGEEVSVVNGQGGESQVVISAFGQQTSVPEPATIALFGLGLVGLGWARRRRMAA